MAILPRVVRVMDSSRVVIVVVLTNGRGKGRLIVVRRRFDDTELYRSTKWG